MDPAQIEQELQAQKASPATVIPPGQQPMAPNFPMAQEAQPQEGGDPAMQGLIQHLDSLPEQAKAYVAQYLTPETAKWAGYVFGSDEVYQYFNQLADPNITLVPVPKDVAEQAMAQPNSSEGTMPAGQPSAPPAPMPQAPAPQLQKPPQGVEHM